MRLILNIGLNRKDMPTLRPADALCAWPSALDLHQARVIHSDTEPTLVVEADDSGLDANKISLLIDRMAQHLDQDCIAVYYPEADHGALIGPNASAWGEFNPAFFITPEGTRLSETLR